MSIPFEFINKIRQIPGPSMVMEDETLIADYGRDMTEDLFFMPGLVVLPSQTAQVSAVAKLCYEYNVPLTVRGGGTGLSGGALPVRGGVVMGMKRMNNILNLDKDNMQVRLQPGVITQELQDYVSQFGFYYPPDPSSRGTCFIGGNLAENAGGPRAVKYGVTKDWVLDLEVVLSNGDIIKTGASVLKNSTGYNLTQLMIGSEGTLGIITEATLKLVPMPKMRWALLVDFDSAASACAAVSEIFKVGVVPSAMEFMERDAILYTLLYKPHLNYQVSEAMNAQLLIEIEGPHENALTEQLDILYPVLASLGSGEIQVAMTADAQDSIWQLRRAIGEAVKSHSIYKEEDTVVPRFHLPALLEKVKALGSEYGFQSVCYGHAGDGNLHINILKGELTDYEWNDRLPFAIRTLFEEVKQLGGTLSGEHGIGWVQKPFMDIIFPPHHMNLMRGIKKLFDPKNILNPGKIFQD